MPSEIFWSFLVTSVIAFMLAVVRLCYKSKCNEIECCCITIKRDVITENTYDENHPMQRVSSEV